MNPLKKNAAVRCDDGVYRYEIGSVSEAVADVFDDYAQNDYNLGRVREELAQSLTGRYTWANEYTKERLLHDLANPPRHLPEAVEAMRAELLGRVAPPSTPRRRIRRNQEWGEELDPERVLARSITPWDRNVREQQPRRTVTIGCNLSINCGGKPENLLYRGAAALALADLLIEQGVNVGIAAFVSTRKPSDRVHDLVGRYTVKDPLMPLDVSSVAFAMCEIAFFRVVVAIGQGRHVGGKFARNLGRARQLPAADRQTVDYLIESDVLNRESAEQWLRGCLTRQESEVCHV